MFENRMSGETGFCQGLGEEMLNASMFTGSLLQASPDQRLRRSWTTLSSFGLQALAMGLLLLLPLVRPDHIPLARCSANACARRVGNALAQQHAEWSCAGANTNSNRRPADQRRRSASAVLRHWN
jgi:hypothetical protein